MSGRDRAKAIIDKFPDERIDRVLFFLMDVQHDAISIEDFAKEQGIVLA